MLSEDTGKLMPLMTNEDDVEFLLDDPDWSDDDDEFPNDLDLGFDTIQSTTFPPHISIDKAMPLLDVLKTSFKNMVKDVETAGGKVLTDFETQEGLDAV